MILQAESNKIRCMKSWINKFVPGGLQHHSNTPSAMQLLMSVPQLIEVVDRSSVWHDTAVLACLVHKFFSIFGITAQLAPLPAYGRLSTKLPLAYPVTLS